MNKSFVDLGMSPLSNSYISPHDLNNYEIYYPLHAYVCGQCLLVQLEEYESPENIFTDYAYYSSYSQSWLSHAKEFADNITDFLRLDENSKVVELASNDGYLLRFFTQKNISVLGIEPAQNVADEAIKNGITTIKEFFCPLLAEKLISEHQADLIVANNVLAHVPDLHGFIEGIKILLKPRGTATIEFPHLLSLISLNQFDTIYHEHFSYFSLLVLVSIFEKHALQIYKVESLLTHGGSLRIYVAHADSDVIIDGSVATILEKEKEAGLNEIDCYKRFSEQVIDVKSKILEFFVQARKKHKKTIGYGAPAKGNTLLNYCGIGSEFIIYTTDMSPHKQGQYLPGTHIPIKSPDEIFSDKPDYLFILPWNLRDEIIDNMSGIRQWGGKFVVPIPEIEIIE